MSENEPNYGKPSARARAQRATADSLPMTPNTEIAPVLFYIGDALMAVEAQLQRLAVGRATGDALRTVRGYDETLARLARAFLSQYFAAPNIDDERLQKAAQALHEKLRDDDARPGARDDAAQGADGYTPTQEVVRAAQDLHDAHR